MSEAGLTLHALLKYMTEKGASDLHITTGSPPQLRIDGSLIPLKAKPLTPAETRQLCYSVLTDSQKTKFEENNELDLSFGVKGLSRFRGNLFIQRGSVSGVFRAIPFKVQTLEELGMPEVVKTFIDRPRGLVLVTGPTGSGKSTTLASMIDLINQKQHGHIITIEEPIEFLHPHKNCIINQREVGADTQSFKGALKYALRQDPDVVLIGEMRDLETIEAAISVSETGHLAFGTLHTNNCAQTIHRIIDVFPPYAQAQIRAQLSFVLEGVVSQQLLPRQGGGRVMAAEIMVPNTAIRNLIREDKIHQVYSQMQMGQTKYGMLTMNQSLVNLYVRRLVSVEEIFMRSSDHEELRNLLKSAGEPIPDDFAGH